ncbi:MAG: YiiX/YebB-like N1pC/P60 family cysteine hydrolase [Pseudomonadota bacterium]
MGHQARWTMGGWLIQWLNYERPPGSVPYCDFDRLRHELRPGDVILVEGRSRVSSVIRWVTTSPWTHAALYVGRLHDIEDSDIRAQISKHLPCEPDTQLIIESMLGQGTIANSLSIYRQDHLRICRPRGLNYKDAQAVIRYAASRLGFDYDMRQIFDLFRFLMPWLLMPRKWRSSLFEYHSGKTTRTVCSTMIAEAFGYIHFPILPLVKRVSSRGVQFFRRNPKLCTPSDFDYSPYFEIIKYPFVDFSDSSSYRLLPWRGSESLSAEESLHYVSPSDHLQTSSDVDMDQSTE